MEVTPTRYCTITVNGALCDNGPEDAVTVNAWLPFAMPLVLPHPASPNTPARITEANINAVRTVRSRPWELPLRQAAASASIPRKHMKTG